MRSVSWEAAGVTPRTLDRTSLLGAVCTLTRRDRALAGIGPWTAGIYLLMALRRSDEGHPAIWPC